MASLTDIKVRRAKEGVHADDSHPGLRLRVGKTRSVWLYRYRDKRTQKLKQVTIGRYPTISLAEARLKWSELQIARDKGGDVREELRALTEGPMTVAKLVDLYINGYARPIKRSWREDARMLAKDIVSRWGKRPASEIRRADVFELLADMLPRGERGAQLLLAACRKAWNFAIDRERVETNPFARLKIVKGVAMSADTAIRAEKPKPRFLDAPELKTFFAKLPEIPVEDSIKDLLQFQLLTASRKGECCDLKWDEIDVDKGIWTLPAEKSKNKQEHLVMLSRQALDIIRRQPRSDGYVFRGSFVRVHLGGNTVNVRLAKHIDKFGIKHFTPHALRHSALTGLSILGCPREIQDRISNHRDASMGTHDDHNPRDKEARGWLQKWADHLDALMVENVVPMGGHGHG